MFEMNVGRLDSLIRIAIGGSIVIYGAGLVNTPLNFAAIIISLFILATGLTGTSPLYTIMGISSGEEEVPKKKGK
jgi:hypothetical protein